MIRRLHSFYIGSPSRILFRGVLFVGATGMKLVLIHKRGTYIERLVGCGTAGSGTLTIIQSTHKPGPYIERFFSWEKPDRI